MKKLFLFISLFFLLPKIALAADIEISCTSNSCSPATSPAIFSSSEIWYPGLSLSKTIRIANNSEDTLTFYNHANSKLESDGLDKVFDFKIDLFGGQNLFNDKLSALYTLPSTPLVTLSANSSALLVYTASMSPELGNDYQNKKTIFDLILNFNGGHDESSNNNDNNHGNNEPSTPRCEQTSPTTAPANLHIQSSSANTITLAWESVNPVTHYALIFTRVRDGAKYGSANIGSGNSYAINNLSGGESYEFEIFGVNGCAPGPSSKITQTVSGATITSRPTSPNGQVLGDDTVVAPDKIIDTLPLSPTPMVLGANSNDCRNPWWKMFFIVITIALPLLVTRIKKEQEYRLKNISVILLLILAFFVDSKFFCTHSMWPLLIVASSFISSLAFKRN